MNQVAPAVAISNEAPVIDSFTASSLLVSQGDTVIIKGTAHDPDKGQTAAMGVAWTTTCAGSLSNEIDVLGSDNGAVPPATLTYTDGSSQVTFTALPAKGDGPCNVTVTVTDANGVLKNSASLTIVVNAASAAGSAKIIANLDTYPVISGLGIVAPATAPIVTGVAIPLFVTASDSDGDALNYSWVSPDCGADGTFGTANLATTTFTLKVGATETTCTFLVTVDDGKYPDGTAKGGVITNHLSLPVSGPGNTTETAPVFGYDYQSQTTIKGGDVVGMAIVATQGCVGGGTIGLAAVASDGTTLGASTPAALGLDPSVFTAALTYTAQAGAENGSPVTVTVTATCSTSGLKATHVFTLRMAPTAPRPRAPPTSACWARPAWRVSAMLTPRSPARRTASISARPMLASRRPVSARSATSPTIRLATTAWPARALRPPAISARPAFAAASPRSARRPVSINAKSTLASSRLAPARSGTSPTPRPATTTMAAPAPATARLIPAPPASAAARPWLACLRTTSARR
jgi:hypothetical protein